MSKTQKPGIHREPLMQDKVDGSGNDSKHRQALGIAASAPFLGNSSGHPDEKPARECRQKPQREERRTQCVKDGRGNPCDLRRVIDVSSTDMASIGDVVELIILSGRQQMRENSKSTL